MTPGPDADQPDADQPDPDQPDPGQPDPDQPDPGQPGRLGAGESAAPRRDRARERAERRRRRARVFGEVLPEGTSDERGETWGDRDGSSDEWLRRQVPPHHG